MTGKPVRDLACRRLLIRRAAAAAAVLAIAGAVLGCDQYDRLSDTTAVALSDPEVRHRIGFSAKRETLRVQLPPPGESLSHNQVADIYRFAKRFRAESNGRLSLSLPAKGAASARIADDIRVALREAEVDEQLVDKSYNGTARGPGAIVRLSYVRPIAVPPECGLWYRDVGHDRQHIPYPQWGCATQRNLAGMVANARDLQRPQDEQPSSSERRAALWSKYAPPNATVPTDDANKAKAPSTTTAVK